MATDTGVQRWYFATLVFISGKYIQTYTDLLSLVHYERKTVYSSYPRLLPFPRTILYSYPYFPSDTYSLETSRPNALDFNQSRTTRTRLRARKVSYQHETERRAERVNLLLKHMLKYALLQNKYVNPPPVAKLPFNQLTSATALSLPIYAKEPW